MPRRKQAGRTTVKDFRSILRLKHEKSLSVRAVSERLKIGKTSVATYLLRAKETGLSVWPLATSTTALAKFVPESASTALPTEEPLCPAGASRRQQNSCDG